jgi:hypothetical protein
VDGLGRLGAAVAATLAGAGVGRVEGVDDALVARADVLAAGHGADDVGTSRTRSLSRAVERVLGRSAEPAPPADGAQTEPDLVVLVREDAVELAPADELVHRGVDHLAVVVGAERVVVGPLVVPGRGPCLRCLHLHRCDRDPAWPRLAAQLVTPRAAEPPQPTSRTPRAAAAAGPSPARTHAGDAAREPAPRGEAGSATAAAGLVTLQVLTHLDGVVRPVSAGRTLDLVLPDGLVERRRWTTHPRCGCARLPDAGSRPAARGSPDPAGPAHPVDAATDRSGPRPASGRTTAPCVRGSGP